MKRFKQIAAITLVLLSTTTAYAALGDLLNSSTVQTVVNAVTSNSKVTPSTLAGLWSYSGTAVELKSDNFLTNAAGTLVTSQIESKLNDYCLKAGIKQDTFSFTFNPDNKFSCTSNGKTITGKYEIIADGTQIRLNFAAASNTKLGSMDAKINISGKNLLILFRADKLLEIISTVSTVSNNSSLQTINSLLKNYDELQLGFNLIKK